MRVNLLPSQSSPLSRALAVTLLCVMAACGESAKAKRTADSLRLAAHFAALAADTLPEPAPPAPAPAVRQAQSSAPPVGSGWVSGDAAAAAMRERQEADARIVAQRHQSALQRPDQTTQSPPSPAELRRRAGLAPQADCNRAASNVRTIKDSRRYGGRLTKLNLSRGFVSVDSTEANRILADEERFIAEKCTPRP